MRFEFSQDMEDDIGGRVDITELVRLGRQESSWILLVTVRQAGITNVPVCPCIIFKIMIVLSMPNSQDIDATNLCPCLLDKINKCFLGQDTLAQELHKVVFDILLPDRLALLYQQSSERERIARRSSIPS